MKEIINSFKKALRFCGNNRIEVYNEKCMKYFSEFFTGRPKKSKYPGYDAGTYGECGGVIEIGLYIPTDEKDNPTIFIEYDVFLGRDDIESEFIIFNDDDAHYENGGDWGNRNSDDTLYIGDLEYSDIDLEIWKIMTEIALSVARKQIEESVVYAEKSLKRSKEIKDEFEHLAEDVEL